MSQFEPDHDVEQELRAALHDRAEAIHPTDRWTTIERAVSGAPATRRWPTMLLAAAAVLAVAVAVLVARPGLAPPHPAAPTPRVSASTPDADRIRPDVRLPIFSIANNAADRADTGLGLRRDWVGTSDPTFTPGDRVTAALNAAMGRRTATAEQFLPWEGVELGLVSVEPQVNEIRVRTLPTAEVPDDVAHLAVHQLVETARAVVGIDDMPVRFILPEGVIAFWNVDVSDAFIGRAPSATGSILTNLWITEPAHSVAGTMSVTANEPLTLRGEASVHEGTVQWQVTNSTREVVASGVTSASVGAPGRGTFEFTIKGLPAGRSTIRAFSSSMAEGRGDLADDTVAITVG